MSQIQKIILTIFLVDLCGILYLQHPLEIKNPIIGVVLFTVIMSLVLASLMVKKKSKDHQTIGYAILFIGLGDVFLVISGIFLPDYDHISNPLGMLAFMCAYATLSLLFAKNFALQKSDMLKAIPVLLVILPVLSILLPNIQGVMFILAIVFSLVVSFMAWNALCCLHRGYYNNKVATRFAIAGFLMLLSDMGVAFVLFYPAPAISQSAWLQNEIWITYVPAWALIFVNLLEEKLVA